MTKIEHDDKLLIHFFHKTLIGATIKWYTQLDNSQVKSWKDLVDAFIKKYQYNLDIAPTQNDF